MDGLLRNISVVVDLGTFLLVSLLEDAPKHCSRLFPTVTRKGSGPKYAMKLVRKAEVTKTGKVKKSQGVEASALAMEYRIYTTRLRQMQAVPKLAQAAPYGNANPGTKPSDEVRYMVMEMCNRTLTEVLDKNPEGLPFGDIAQAALHVVSHNASETR